MFGMIHWKTILYFLLPIYLVRSEIRISLDSKEANRTWRVSNGTNGINIDGSVPGGIYTDLQRGKIIHDNLFFRFNDQCYRWVGLENWTYTTTFDVPKDVLEKKSINLVFHGIDTIADICLNGQYIGYARNMFVRYVIPVKDHLKATENNLKIILMSPISEAKKLAEKEKYKIPPECPPAEQFGECHINFLRKMQASFSWDWGPAFPSVGIWKSVEIEAYDHAIIRDVTVSTKLKDSKWVINATSYIESYPRIFPYLITATIELDGFPKIIAQNSKQGLGDNHNFTTDIIFEFDEGQLELWWPNGYGNQTLYTLTVVLTCITTDEGSTCESRKQLKFGVRTVELVEEEIKPNTKGLSFYFKVNNIPIFAKGSNWIPAHILPELGCDKATVKHLLLSAKEVHMNMLRVWGGGVYESDYFYNLADELGILIWQDFMFAVALYPTNKNFLLSVSTEIEQQVQRLQHHPSIVLWAGNNENEAALRSNWFGTNDTFDLYKNDYIKLYVNTIEPIVEKIDDTRSYIVSSPTNGKRSREEGHIAKNPYSPLYGDVHYYNYENDPWNSSHVINTRFSSEYGFQSMPSFALLEKVSKAEDRRMRSRFTTSRQHHRKGYEEMHNLIRYNLALPADDDTENYFKNFIYYSQIYQAIGIKTLTEKYRRDRGRITINNEKFTMGALYWQLNDVWEAPTWSSIEFGGKWKMLHYYAKHFFNPIIVSPELDKDDNVDVYIVSDLLEDVYDVEFNVSVFSWCSFYPKSTKSATVTVEKAKSKVYMRIELEELLRETNCTKNTCFLHFRLRHNEMYTFNNLFLSPFSNIPNLKPANIKVRAEKSKTPNIIDIELKSDTLAPFVWLETEVDGQFSHNGFLQMRETKNIEFHNRGEPIDFDHFKKTLKVRSLLSQ